MKLKLFITHWLFFYCLTIIYFSSQFLFIIFMKKKGLFLDICWNKRKSHNNNLSFHSRRCTKCIVIFFLFLLSMIWKMSFNFFQSWIWLGVQIIRVECSSKMQAGRHKRTWRTFFYLGHCLPFAYYYKMRVSQFNALWSLIILVFEC